ncbi:mitochondrial large subunit ribosomal protein-domain-containing protein [Daldinia bambusicola]|nr:mitochondrial large subunit ribosomal protein-domain-containing protein [Daldinia bambusicola]
MLLPRTLRRLAAPSASILTSSTRFALPIRTRCLSMSIPTSSDESAIPSEPISSAPIPSEPTEPASFTTQTEQTEQEEPKEKAQLPYFVARNSLNNLGVYHKEKRGGNLRLTLVKGGEGNLLALKQDMKDALQLKDSDISVNNVTRQIVIRGHKKMQVFNFLHTMGF